MSQAEPRKKVAPLLSGDREVSCYCDAFIASSDRVRYAIIILTVASILIFIGYKNGFETSWTNLRLMRARTAMHLQSWTVPDCRSIANAVDKAACDWTKAKDLRSPQEVLGQIAILEQAQLENIYTIKIPIIGISFDINDLGLFGSLALFVMMLILTFAMARQHENLYLVLWRIREIGKDDDIRGDKFSMANLLYHTLAMTQHFTRPPTLGRWPQKRDITSAIAGEWDGALHWSLSKFLVFLPVFVQAYSLFNDWMTRQTGMIFSKHWTIFTLVLESILFVAIVLMTAACLIYTHSNERRWAITFFQLNPWCSTKKKEPWLTWVGLKAENGKIMTIVKPARKSNSQVTQGQGLEASAPKPVAGVQSDPE